MSSRLYDRIARYFADGPEHMQRLSTPFVPSKIDLASIRAAVPKHLQERSIYRSLCYLIQDVSMALALYGLATCIPGLGQNIGLYGVAARSALWLAYWFFQGLVFASWWVLAHDAGHNTLFGHKWMNVATGFILHTFLLVPYWNWRSTHRIHHKSTGSIEKDVSFVPKARRHYGLPAEAIAHVQDYHDIFEETPIYTLNRMIMMQTLGLPIYLLTDIMGNPDLPRGTNHILPSSPLFIPSDRNGIIASNLGIIGMFAILKSYIDQSSWTSFLMFYFIPYLLANHWVVMLTFLHHSDPSIPHYRGKTWTYVRGAAATVDRPLMGWMGRFFLHNVSHDHIAHHLFPNAPFCRESLSTPLYPFDRLYLADNLPEITAAIKPVLGSDYNYDSTNSFRALYRAFTQCCFIEDDGEILFYKDRSGIARRRVASEGGSSR